MSPVDVPTLEGLRLPEEGLVHLEVLLGDLLVGEEEFAARGVARKQLGGQQFVHGHRRFVVLRGVGGTVE